MEERLDTGAVFIVFFYAGVRRGFRVLCSLVKAQSIMPHNAAQRVHFFRRDIFPLSLFSQWPKCHSMATVAKGSRLMLRI